MKRQQKLTFFIEKRRAVEPPENDEEGPEKDGERSEDPEQFNFEFALQHWRKKKERRIFSG